MYSCSCYLHISLSFLALSRWRATRLWTQSLPFPLFLMLMLSVSLSLPCNLSRFMWSEVFTSWIYKHQLFSYMLVCSLCLTLSFSCSHSLALSLKRTSTTSVNTQTHQRLNAHFANVIKRIHGKLYNLLKFSERSILLVSLIRFTRFSPLSVSHWIL